MGNLFFFGCICLGGINWVGVFIMELNILLILGYNYVFFGGIVDKNIIFGYFDDICSFMELMEFWEVMVFEIFYILENIFVGVLYGINDILSEYWECD